jgi:hypothetical protein
MTKKMKAATNRTTQLAIFMKRLFIILIAIFTRIYKTNHVDTDPSRYDKNEEFDSYEERVEWLNAVTETFDLE